MIKFGTGGWRAVIGDGFTKENVQILASAMAAKMKAENVADKGIVLGYDRRFLSKEAMQWAVTNGVMSGKAVNTVILLDPKGFATRAECAQMIMNFIKNTTK